MVGIIKKELELEKHHSIIQNKQEQEKKDKCQSTMNSNTKVTFISSDGSSKNFKNLNEFNSKQNNLINISSPRILFKHSLISRKNIHKNNLIRNSLSNRLNVIINRQENTFKEYVEPWTYSVEESINIDIANGKVNLNSIPKEENEEDKTDSLLSDVQHNLKQEQRRIWDNWKENNKRGFGNPYFDCRR